MLRFILAISLTASCFAESPPPVDDGVQVSVLGYHDFSESDEETQMKIRTSKFRLQMETLRELGLEVISMADFQAWKRGEKSIPERSVVITIDDGWKSVYTEAFPVLKEFGYPFTLFLYKNYVDGGGKALTTPMIEEMIKHGATIGSHSVSHPYPGTVKNSRAQGPDAYDEFLRNEMGESKRFLEAKFGDAVTTYAYPGGFHTQEMHPLAEEFGYQHLFTVLPGKVKRHSPDATLPRYIILGTHDPIFELATQFTGALTSSSSDPTKPPATVPFPVSPDSGAIIEDRLPVISVDLSDAGAIDPESLVMKVSGFGKVPAAWNPDDQMLRWKTNRKLRLPHYQVQVTWKDDQGEAPEKPLRWNFQIDPEAAYVPKVID
ncbi:polysaccharide deacetylase family protein [Haloferula rosea]|uniref:Polysaccharide deacetylase family protein n=1 Tax=Haloferula rosea TaxID=490093 RepID=A0A934RDG8_9BACT|nr:polysaccharide deacetylase family protein [Haloferula rosea]MBK1826410.1 polysaccharide deacetylase family protein [Haloferula rosea]